SPQGRTARHATRNTPGPCRTSRAQVVAAQAVTGETDMNAMESLVRYGYFVIFGAVFAEQIGLPFPSEPFLLAGGGLSGSGSLAPGARTGRPPVPGWVGARFWSGPGRRRGPRGLGWLGRMSLGPDSGVRRPRGVFDRWGARSLVVGKFVPGLSTIAPPLAG